MTMTLIWLLSDNNLNSIDIKALKLSLNDNAFDLSDNNLNLIDIKVEFKL